MLHQVRAAGQAPQVLPQHSADSQGNTTFIYIMTYGFLYIAVFFCLGRPYYHLRMPVIWCSTANRIYVLIIQNSSNILHTLDFFTVLSILLKFVHSCIKHLAIWIHQICNLNIV